VPWQQ
jgi:hypothetical protein